MRSDAEVYKDKPDLCHSPDMVEGENMREATVEVGLFKAMADVRSSPKMGSYRTVPHDKVTFWSRNMSVFSVSFHSVSGKATYRP
jgi:hypothetical protein